MSSPKQSLTFSDIMKMQKSNHSSQSQMSDTDLRDAVRRVVSSSQNTDGLLSEVLQLNTILSSASESSTLEVGKSLLPTVTQYLYREATGKLQTPNTAAAETCAEKITEIIRCNHGDSSCKERLTPTNRDKLDMCLHLVQRFIRELQFSRSLFISVLSREQAVPLEVMWRLHTTGVFTLDKFLLSKSEDSFPQDFAKQLVCLCCCQGDSKPFKDDIRKGFMSFLINNGFPEKLKKDEICGSLKQVCISILNELTKNVLNNPTELSVMIYACVTTCGQIYPESMRKFSAYTLSLIMSYNACLKASQAIKQQSNWKSAKVNTCISSFYRQLLVPFDVDNVLEILQRVLEREEVNWETVLSFLATYLVCFPEAPRLLTDYISSVLREGLETCDVENTIIAFLLARQCCVEGLHVFPTYHHWFQKTFGDGSRSPASSRKSFTFLMKFLTDIVPYETGKHLRVHILRPPYVPPKCRDLLSDYVALAKTRLADLKETLDAGGIYDNSHQADSKQVLQRCEEDVLTAVTAFESTGKIPSSVMETSIFRKPYYIGKFLPTLLKARPLPDKPDSRVQMIEALKRVDKIPQSLYAKYEDGCRKEAQQLIDGVFEPDHDETEDLMLEPREQLQFRLGQLQDVVLRSKHVQAGSLGQTVSQLISITSEKIELVLGGSRPGETGIDLTITHINLSYPDVSHTHIEVVDVLLNFICKCMTLDLQTATPQLTWLLQLTRMLSEHKTLHKAFFTRFFCLIYQSQSLKDHHLIGLSALAACVTVLQPCFGVLSVSECTVCHSLSATGSFIEVLFDTFPCWSDSSLELFGRFWSQYLKFVFLKFDTVSTCYVDEQHGIIPADLIRKFTFLCWRFVPGLRTHTDSGEGQSEDEMLLRLIYHSHRFQQCAKDTQIDFASWMNFEMAITPDNDHLSHFERRAYHEWAIHHHFLQTDDKDGGFNRNHSQLSSALFQAVLNSLLSSSCSGIPPCGQCKKKGDHPCKTNGLEFMSYLQFLVLNLSSGEETTSVPWLLRQLDKFLSFGDTDNMLLQEAKIGIFFRMVQALPPHLFLSDQFGILPDQQTMQEVVARIEKYLVHLVEGCALTVCITSYLLHSVISLRRSAGHCGTLQLLTTHQLMSVSCLVHWNIVQSLLSSQNEDEELFSHLYRAKSWYQRCTELNRLQPVPHHLPSWVCAVEMFAAAVDRKRVDDVTVMMTTTDNHHTEVIKFLCELLLSYISGVCSSNKENSQCVALRNLLVSVLSRQPGALPHIVSGNKTDLDSVTRSTHNLRGHTLLRVLTVSDSQIVMNILKHESNVKCLLDIFQHVRTRFESQDVEAMDSRIAVQPASLTEVVSHAKFIREILLTVPLPCLYNLNTNVLLFCGFDIKLTVDRRLTSGQ